MRSAPARALAFSIIVGAALIVMLMTGRPASASPAGCAVAVASASVDGSTTVSRSETCTGSRGSDHAVVLWSVLGAVAFALAVYWAVSTLLKPDKE